MSLSPRKTRRPEGRRCRLKACSTPRIRIPYLFYVALYLVWLGGTKGALRACFGKVDPSQVNRRRESRIMCAMGIDDSLTSELVQRILTAAKPDRIILFGSAASGTMTRDSDIDLLVVLPQVTDKRQAAIEIRRVLADVPVSKDIVITTPGEIARRGHLVGTILRPALQEGKVLYERE